MLATQYRYVPATFFVYERETLRRSCHARQRMVFAAEKQRRQTNEKGETPSVRGIPLTDPEESRPPTRRPKILLGLPREKSKRNMRKSQAQAPSWPLISQLGQTPCHHKPNYFVRSLSARTGCCDSTIFNFGSTVKPAIFSLAQVNDPMMQFRSIGEHPRAS